MKPNPNPKVEIKSNRYNLVDLFEVKLNIK